jgi:hypothetical protein
MQWLYINSAVTLHETCSDFTWNMQWLYIKYAVTLHKSCSDFTWNMQWLYLKHAVTLHETCSVFTWNTQWLHIKYAVTLHKSCSDFTWNMQWLYLKYAVTLHKRAVTVHERVVTTWNMQWLYMKHDSRQVRTYKIKSRKHGNEWGWKCQHGDVANLVFETVCTSASLGGYRANSHESCYVLLKDVLDNGLIKPKHVVLLMYIFGLWWRRFFMIVCCI